MNNITETIQAFATAYNKYNLCWVITKSGILVLKDKQYQTQ